MYCNDDFATERDNGIVISVYNELLNEKAVGDEFCWGYYLRIENNSPDKISLLGRKISITDVKGRQVSVASEEMCIRDRYRYGRYSNKTTVPYTVLHFSRFPPDAAPGLRL